MTTDKAFSYFIGSMVGCVFLLCITFLLSFTIFQHADQLHVISQFYTIGVMDSSRQSEVVPFEENIQNQELVDEMMVRYYLDMRYSVIPDGIEMLRRWRSSSPFARLTTPDLYNTFAGNLEKKIKNAAGTPIVKTVDIVAIQSERVGQYRGSPIRKYTVDLDIYNRAADGQEKVQKKRVIIQLRHVPQKVSTRKDFANPYGTIITSFVETERKL